MPWKASSGDELRSVWMLRTASITCSASGARRVTNGVARGPRARAPYFAGSASNLALRAPPRDVREDGGKADEEAPAAGRRLGDRIVRPVRRFGFRCRRTASSGPDEVAITAEDQRTPSRPATRKPPCCGVRITISEVPGEMPVSASVVEPCVNRKRLPSRGRCTSSFHCATCCALRSGRPAVLQLHAVRVADAGVGERVPHHHDLAAALQQLPQRLVGASGARQQQRPAGQQAAGPGLASHAACYAAAPVRASLRPP